MRDSHKRSLGNLRRGIHLDIDQIHAQLQDPEIRQSLEHQPIDIEQIGMAQHYCVECAKYFESDIALVEHKRGAKHRKRVKLLKEIPYSHEEADLAAGVNSSKSKYAVRRSTQSTTTGEGAATTAKSGVENGAVGGDVVMT